MDFRLTDDQRMLQDSARKFLNSEYGFDSRRKLVEQDGGFGQANWDAFAEMGWLAMGIPETYGGLGATMAETILLMEEYGRALVVEPYVGSAVLATQAIVAAGNDSQKRALLPRLAEGREIIALAYSEREARGALEHVACKADRSGSKYILNGYKTAVLGAPFATQFIVAARTAKVRSGPGGITLFLVDPKASGLRVHATPLVDGSHAGDLVLDDVEVDGDAVLGRPGEALPALQAGVDQAIIALCAESIGAMEKSIEITAAYVKDRKQFGVPIGSFQAVQHRLADMSIELEMARSMLYRGLASLEIKDTTGRQAGISASKAMIAKAAQFVCGQGIQLHGGIGMAEECNIGHFFKRMVTVGMLFGNADYHLNRYTDILQSRLAEDHGK